MSERAPLFPKPADDYLRVMTASPEVAIADPRVNVDAILACYGQAKHAQVEVLALPELCITGYSTADLFFSRHVLERSDEALATLAAATIDGPAMVIGAPIEDNGILYNCAVLVAEGSIKGIIPKSYPVNYGEFYEDRWFSSGVGVVERTLHLNDQDVPFGTDVLFRVNGTNIGLEVCEDLFAPIPPSSQHALAGAEVIINTSASNEVVGKPEYRRALVTGAAARLICAYVYTSAGRGESNADTVYGGHQIVAEIGRLVAEVEPLASTPGGTVYDIDKTYIRHDRLVNKTFGTQANQQRKTTQYRTVDVCVPQPNDDILHRKIDAKTHVPKSQAEFDQRCEYMFAIMANGVAQAVTEGRTFSMNLALSGGLDSTLALLTLTFASEILGKEPGFIHTLGMPGKASSDRTQDNAARLANALGTTHRTIPIGELSTEALAAIGHDQKTEDTTYENTQARLRTLLLMNHSNMTRGIAIGTGDMSEIAQGWCTFNGDHMSMYNPNAGVPKTLVKHLVNWYAEHRAEPEVRDILRDILDTPISPELTGNGDLSQTTEDIIGPYELLDFFDKEQSRYGSRPAKIGFLAVQGYGAKYDEVTIAHWVDSFFTRFTGSQWKRESMPNSAKLGTVSHSPRTDLRMAPNTSSTWHK